MQDYIAKAVRTKSDKFYGELVERKEFFQQLGDAIEALNQLDKIKKALFYGKGDMVRNFTLEGNCQVLAKPRIDKDGKSVSKEQMIDIIHSILGSATEAGENLELLRDTVQYSKPFDTVNFCEEIFDGQWYNAIGCAAINYTFEEGQERNIEKLMKRFPEKFTEEKAINRDLFEERKVLERNWMGKPAQPGDVLKEENGVRLTLISIDNAPQTQTPEEPT